jgi:hypothetical protein
MTTRTAFLRTGQRAAARDGMASVVVITILALVALLLMSSGRMVRHLKQEVDLAERLQQRHLEATAGHARTQAAPLEAETEGPPDVVGSEPAAPPDTNVTALEK